MPRSSTPKAFRQACREYALAQIDVQRKDFKRLGVMGDWDRPYLTMGPRYEAEQLRAFAQIIRNGHLYKGSSPCTGASIAARRWPRRKSSTRSALRRRSTCVSRSSTAPTWRGALGVTALPAVAVPVS